jgi:hypothetical protein
MYRQNIGSLLAYIAVGAVVVISALWLYPSFRSEANLGRLEEEANSTDSATSYRAIAELSRNHSERARDILLKVAKNSPTSDGASEAIRALEDHHQRDPMVASALAELLQPHEDLATRQAVASALQNLPCDRDCTISILSYIERGWRGDPMYEDSLPMDSKLRGPIVDERTAVIRELNSVLLKDKITTGGVLMDHYGLGSPLPSKFALYMVDQLDARDFCQVLGRSYQSTIMPSLKQDVYVTAQKLGCK